MTYNEFLKSQLFAGIVGYSYGGLTFIGILNGSNLLTAFGIGGALAVGGLSYLYKKSE